MKIYKTARKNLLNEIFDQSRNKLEKNRNADLKKKSGKSRFSSISPRITGISGQLVTPAGVKPRLAITDRRTNTIPPLSIACFICKYTYFRMLAGNGRSKLLDLNKMATKLSEHCIYTAVHQYQRREGHVCIDTGERTHAREYLVAILQELDHPREFIFLVIFPACMRMCAAHTSQRATPSGQFSRGKVNVCGTPAMETRNISFWKIVCFVSGVLTTSAVEDE